MVTIDDVKKAAEVLSGVARRTDLIHSPAFSTNGDIYLKTENLQLTGSFKLRGAYNKIASLTDEEKAKGLIACSAGNHAQGVAYAASQCGAKSVICMPASAPISKVENTKALGAEARTRNMRGAFSLKAGAPVPEQVLLVDDIYTTGTTMDEAARALKLGGVKRVWFITLCGVRE